MIRIRKHGTVVASFATPQEIVISHANDSMRVGDGTDLMGPLQNVGGVLCYPVKIMEVAAGSLALDATLTGGTQRSKITDGADNVEIETVGAEKALKVAVISTVGGGAAPAHTDDAAFTPGSDQVTVCGALYDDTATDSVDEGDAGALRMTADRLLKIQIAGILAGVALPITDNAGSITIDNTNIDAALSTLATQATLAAMSAKLPAALGQTTMAASMSVAIASNQSAVPVSGTFWQATQPVSGTVAVSSIAAGDNNIGNVDVVTLPALAAGTNNIGDVDVLTLPALPAGTNNIGDVDVLTLPGVAGTAAHDAAVSGNPVRIGARARTALPTAVAQDDTVDVMTDKFGRQLIGGSAPVESLKYQTTAITNTTETTIVTAAASEIHDIVAMIITNNSTVDSICTIKDSTTGTSRLVFLVPKGGGIVFTPAMPIPQLTAANNNWTATMTTTATATNINVIYSTRAS